MLLNLVRRGAGAFDHDGLIKKSQCSCLERFESRLSTRLFRSRYQVLSNNSDTYFLYLDRKILVQGVCVGS